MQSVKLLISPYRMSRRKLLLMSSVLLVPGIAGCGGGTASSVKTTQQAPATYFAPPVAGAALSVSQTYTIDDTADKFSQTTYLVLPPQEGPQVMNAGVLSLGQRGLRNLGVTAHYTNVNGYVATYYDPPQPGSFAVELAGQAGGLVQLVGQPAQPMVATQCPNLSAAQTYQFITIPGAFVPPSTSSPLVGTWDPTSETAYGSVDISSSGSTVNLKNIHQFTLPSEGGTGKPALPGASSATGTCAPTFFGNTVSIPGQLVITDPGNTQNAPGQATLGIGTSGGLLVEDNGAGTVQVPAGTLSALPYVNVLGAGTGAVGLPKPSNPVDTGSLVGAQYLGFIYTAGVYTHAGNPPVISSHLASFGFSGGVPSSCPTVPAVANSSIYGGDFDPSTSSNGFGKCDFVIDLGAQDASTNGLYPRATVWVGAGYAANATSATYSFPAVAISGQINGKYAIFLIGVDSTQPWAIYLLQSN